MSSVSTTTPLVPTAPEWEAAPLASLVRLAWPIVISMLSVATMTLVDTLFVSRLGSAAVAGVGLAGVLTFSLWCFPIGVIRAVKILISQAVGAGQREQVQPVLSSGLLVAFGLGLLAAALGSIGAPLLSRTTATAESGANAASYLSIRVLASVPFLVLITVQEARQGFGNSRTMMYTTLFGNALNVALDYVFILVHGGGVAGAAWASNVAITCECIALSYLHVRSDGLQLRAVSLSLVRKIWRLGVPSGVQFGMEVSSFGVMMLILSSHSEMQTAAHQIAIQVLHFAFLPASALGEAGSVLAGQAIGAGRGELVIKASGLTLKLALGYALLCALVLLVLRYPIASAFTQDQELLSITLNLFMLMAVFQFFDAANLVARSILRGVGDVRFVAVVSIASAWLCTPPLTYLLGVRAGYGVYGAWVGISIEVLLATALLWHRLARGRYAVASVLD